MPQVTLREALRLPEFKRGDPVVLTTGASLDRPIRWVHATELTEIGDFIRSGDLMLTMGTAMPDDDRALADFAQTLADVECVGLVVELGRRWTDGVPEALVRECDSRNVPVVMLTHVVKFAALAQAVGEQIVDSQLGELRDAQRVHDTFSELSFTQAGPREILDAVQRLTGGPVVVENDQHRPIDYLAAPGESAGFLDGWQARSARVRISGRTGWDERNGWLVTRLGSDQQAWGRLVIAASQDPAPGLVAVAERAAAALAFHRLHDRDRGNLIRRTHHELMSGLCVSPESEDVLRRCELARFPTVRRHFLGLIVRPDSPERGRADVDELAAACVLAADHVRTPALVCEVDRDLRVLLSVPPSANLDALAEKFAVRLLDQHQVSVSAGTVALGRGGIDRSLVEAGHVADAIATEPTKRATNGVYRLEDLHLRGLLALFGDDDRVRLFTERELSAVRAHPDSANLEAVLRALLLHPRSKSDAAASIHLSRPAFYDRLAKLQAVLDTDLDNPEVRVSLHVALIADDLSRTRT